MSFQGSTRHGHARHEVTTLTVSRQKATLLSRTRARASRRGYLTEFVMLMAMASMIAFCGVSNAHAEDCSGAKRLFEHAGGIACVPEDPQRIVTLSDQNALLPLLELGVRPVGSAGLIFPDGRREFRRTQGYDTAGIVFVGDYRDPDFEAVAVLQPDVIVTNAGRAGLNERFTSIAPVVQIDTATQPLERALYQFADLVNKIGRARELEHQFEEQVAEIEHTYGSLRDSTTVSFIAYGGSGELFGVIGPSQAYGMILRALDPVRPEAELSLSQDNQTRSLETLAAHNADVMFQVVFDKEWLGSRQYETFMALPFVQHLPVAQAGQIFAIDGTEIVGSAWGKAMTGLKEISSVLTDPQLHRDLIKE